MQKTGLAQGGIFGDVRPLQFFVDAFVNTFGITRPTPRQERMAGWFIAGMLTLIVVVMVAVVLLVRSVLLH